MTAPEENARRVVLITGAAGGFGGDAARAFAREGARLVLCDLDGPALETLADELRDGGCDVLARAMDVCEEAEHCALIEAALSRHGALDVAVNNAGIAHPLTPLSEIDVETFDRVMAVNVRGVFLGMKHQIPVMQAAGQGVILNIASAAGLVGAGQLAAYGAAKHAVVGLTRAAADETARHGIRVNALCPAFSETPLFADMAGAMAEARGLDSADARRRIVSRSPMGRVARPGEVVQAMLWMCARDNSFMTGQALAIDGGLTAI